MPGYVIANWKMYKTKKEALEFAEGLKDGLSQGGVVVGVSPAFPYLETLSNAFRGVDRVCVFAQNVAFAEAGAFTGEVSASMIEDAGAKGVIIGHSERRHVFKEDPSWMVKKIQLALDRELVVVYCVGETLEERDLGVGPEVVSRQLAEGLGGLEDESKASIRSKETLVIAYEPVWAIGTGRNMEPIEAKEAASLIKKNVSELLEGYVPPVLYGGSVNPRNIQGFAGHFEIDGVLVGGASLDLGRFLPLIKAFERA
jgi:triosephosphate isomerase